MVAEGLRARYVLGGSAAGAGAGAGGLGASPAGFGAAGAAGFAWAPAAAFPAGFFAATSMPRNFHISGGTTAASVSMITGKVSSPRTRIGQRRRRGSRAISSTARSFDGG